jgi:hypothetical protein
MEFTFLLKKIFVDLILNLGKFGSTIVKYNDYVKFWKMRFDEWTKFFL